MPKAKEFQFKRGLNSLLCTKTGQLITVNDFVTIILKNSENITGILTSTSENSITLRVSDYEYTESGIAYTQNLILTKDVKEFSKSIDGSEMEQIDWKAYYESLYEGDGGAD